jgi:hypothetical protein
MNYKRIALGLLCGLLCVAPAFAGVVDADLVSNKETTEYRDLDDVDKTTTSTNVTYKASGSAKIAKINSAGNNVGWRNVSLSGKSSTTQGAIEAAYKDMRAESGRGGWALNSDNWTGSLDVAREEGTVYAHHGSSLTKTSGNYGGNFFTWSNARKVSSNNSDTRKWTNKTKDQGDTVETTNYLFIGDVDDFTNTYEIGGDKLTTHHIDRWRERTGKLTIDEVYQIDVWGYVSPIVLDLDGDGAIQASKGQYLAHPETFAYDAPVAMFDFNGNNFPVLTEWVGENDGLLCRPEADGSVKGINLFGTTSGSENGYDSMALLDANKNGALEGAELEGLYVWQDRNCNGIADKGELSTVESLGITSISVKHDNMASTFVRNGQTFKSFDWWPSVKDVRRIKVHSF